VQSLVPSAADIGSPTNKNKKIKKNTREI